MAKLDIPGTEIKVGPPYRVDNGKAGMTVSIKITNRWKFMHYLLKDYFELKWYHYPFVFARLFIAWAKGEWTI